MTNMHAAIHEEKLTEAYRLLIKMRDNCVKHADDQYDDPKREAKREALNIAMAAMGRSIPPRWIRVEERLPENDVPVLVSAKRKGWNGKEYSVVFTAFHTDGTTHTEDSRCDWNLEDTGLKYCEETDDYIIPEAWWEDVRYGEEFSKVYDTYVTHWMPLPEPPEVTKP